MLYDGDTFERAGHSFRVTFPRDDDNGAPWEEEDGHGPVSDWTRRDKMPGEFVLDSDLGLSRYYNFAEACKIARRDSWGFLPGALETEKTESGQWRAHVIPARFADLNKPTLEFFADDINAAIHGVYALYRASMTARQYAAGAAMADYERLRQWCDNQWEYVGVVVELLDSEGEGTGETDSVWGIESDSDEYLEETAFELADQIAETENARIAAEIEETAFELADQIA